MSRKLSLSLCVLLCLFSGCIASVEAQDDDSAVRVIVNMVQLNVAVTDKKGVYVTGLRPEDFLITEDGITEKLATFAEGDAPARTVLGSELADGKNRNSTDHSNDLAPNFASLIAGANVFILFDTSNYVSRDFVFAEDAITEFVRSLETADKIAFYSYSRDLSRATALTSDRTQVLRSIRSTVSGDSASLYNTLSYVTIR